MSKATEDLAAVPIVDSEHTKGYGASWSTSFNTRSEVFV